MRRTCTGPLSGPWCGEPATFICTDADHMQWFACEAHRDDDHGATNARGVVVHSEPIAEWRKRHLLNAIQAIRTIHRVTLSLCDECLNNKDNKCQTFGCAACNADVALWDRFDVEVEGYKWEGCPTCHIADSGGWAVRYNVDVSKCITCKGTGLVRVHARETSE